MNDTQINLFLTQLEIPWTEEDLQAVTQAIDNYFRWDGDAFIEAVDAALDAATEAGRDDDVYSLWFKAREMAASSLPEGTDPATAGDVDYLVGAKAIQVSTMDLATGEYNREYNTSHTQFLDSPWHDAFGYVID